MRPFRQGHNNRRRYADPMANGPNPAFREPAP